MANPFLMNDIPDPDVEFEDELAGIERELADDTPEIPPDDPTGTRAQRRQARGQGRAEEKDETIEELRGTISRMEGRLEEMSNRFGQPQGGNPYGQPPPQQPQEDPRLTGIRNRISELEQTENAQAESLVALERAVQAGRASVADLEAKSKEFKSTRAAIAQLNGALGAAAALPHFMPQQPRGNEEWERDKAANPDVFNNPEALALYTGELMIRSKGRGNWKPSQTDKEQVLESVRHKMGLGRYANIPPTQQMVTATTGYPTGNQGGPGAGAQTREMTQLDWAIAKADLPNSTPKEQEAHYRKYVMSQEQRQR